MRYIRTAIIFLSLPILALAGEFTDSVKYTIKPVLKEVAAGNQAGYFLAVEGAANLPDGTQMDVTFTYRFPGNENERYLGYRKCLVSKNVYQVGFGPIKQKPPPGQYLIRVSFIVDRQSDDLVKYLESKYKVIEDISRIETLTIGASAEDAVKERQRVTGLVRQEAQTLKAVLDDIKAHWSGYGDVRPLNSGDIKELRQWSKAVGDKLESLVARILLEDELRAFETVTQDKALIENSASLLKSLLRKMDDILFLKEPPVKANDEYNRKLAGLIEETDRLYKLTGNEVIGNLRAMGIFSLDKDALLARLKKMESIINNAPDGRPLTDEAKSALMQGVLSLSQDLPEVFYSSLCQLVSDITVVITGPGPITRQAKEGIIQRIKALRIEVEAK